MKILVTGCAGFIGSHLCEELLSQGYEVLGIDCFTNFYSRDLKEKNLENLRADLKFNFVEADLNKIDLEKVLKEVEVIYHLAAQAGVRSSWGKNFEDYQNNNILATQRLLEASKEKPLKYFIYASSSSVYGQARELPTKEEVLLKPISPYGVTKLAGENLVYLYWKNFSVPSVSLRYFTVYGPRQRPDMAFTRFIKAILKKENFEIYGDGSQVRDFTYIKDVIKASVSILKIPQNKVCGESFNIGGGNPASINEVIKLVEKITGIKALPEYKKFEKGDVLETRADITKAKNVLNFNPEISLEEGIKSQIHWLEKLLFNDKFF